MTGLVSMALGMALASGAPAAEPDQARLAADLAKLSRRRVFLGHQSVGRNILDGVERLAASERMVLRVIEVRAPGPLEPGALSHAFVGANGDPRSKLAAFARLLAGTGADAPDLALVKFCYVDFGPETDTAAVFEAYQAALGDLARSHPRTTFVHVTVPLTTIQSGPKAVVKQLLGRQPYGLLENARREEFNARLRTAYQGRAPLFDLARLESTSAAGTPVAAEWQGRKIPALDPASTDDGGHLNPAAQDRVARALVAYLASLP